MTGDVRVAFNGQGFAGFKKVTVKQSFDQATGECTVTISPQPDEPFPVEVGDTAVVTLDAQPVITGHVHEVSSPHEWESHDIEIHIRDKTQDFLDSTIGPNLPQMKTPVSLKDVLSTALQTMGLSSIKVIDKVSPKPFGPGEVVTGGIDERGFNFADRWTTKRQVLLNTDGKGNLVIDRNQGRRGLGFLHKGREDDTLNNVKSARYRTSDLSRSNTTACAGQKSTNDREHWESKPKSDAPAQAEPLQKNWGVATDSSVRPERRMYFRGVKGLEGETPEKAAAWQSSLAKGRNFEYVALVAGFGPSPGKLWWPGVLVPVYDWHYRVSAELLIKDVEFSKDYESGSTTTITLAPGDSFTDQPEGSTGATRTSSMGVGTPSPKKFAAAVIKGVTSA